MDEARGVSDMDDYSQRRILIVVAYVKLEVKIGKGWGYQKSNTIGLQAMGHVG